MLVVLNFKYSRNNSPRRLNESQILESQFGTKIKILAWQFAHRYNVCIWLTINKQDRLLNIYIYDGLLILRFYSFGKSRNVENASKKEKKRRVLV